MEGKKDNFFFKNILDFHKKEAGICEKDPPTKCAKSYEILPPPLNPSKYDFDPLYQKAENFRTN
jgi:hypothetical protein